MSDLDVWYANADGYYMGELHARNATTSLEALQAAAALKGQTAIDASGGTLTLNADGTISVLNGPLRSPMRDAAFLLDAQTLRTFMANVSPTAAEIVVAERVLIRMVARILHGVT